MKKISNNIRSQVFTIAHFIKSAFNSFSEALKAAWTIIKMNCKRKVSFTFRKANGEIRKAVGIATGKLETIEKGFVKFRELKADGSEQWRSFKIKTLIF